MEQQYGAWVVTRQARDEGVTARVSHAQDEPPHHPLAAAADRLVERIDRVLADNEERVGALHEEVQ